MSAAGSSGATAERGVLPEIPSSGSPLRRISTSLTGVRLRLLTSGVLGALATLCAIGLLATSGWLISRASQQPSVLYLQVAIVAVRAFGLGRGFFRYGERLVSHDAAFRALTGLRAAIYRRLEVLAPQGLALFGRGDLLARLVADVDATQDLPLRVLLPGIAALVAGLVSVTVAWALLPAAGVTLLVALLAGATVVPWVTVRVGRRAVSDSVESRSELSVRVVDLLRGCADVVACGAAGEALNRCRDTDDALTRQARRASTSAGLGAALGVLIAGAAVVAALAAGVAALQTGRLDGVNLAVVVLLPLAAYEAVASLPAAALSLVNVRAASERLVDVLDTPAPIREPASPQAQPAGPYTLVLRDVGASWSATDQPTLSGIDLDLGPGGRVAVVGTSGAGKTTLASVLLRFLEYTGSVTLNGVECRELSSDAVRRVIGLCAQDAHIFDSSVEANLRLARPEATEAELMDALERVRLLDWVESLPDGLATSVGEHGSRMSGGQRQRLALARALLADFPVLLLDEPTEHLDPRAAQALTADLLTVTEGRSVVLVTHRLLGLEEMDEIVVLDAGAVAERGRHAALLARGGPYATEWQRESEMAEMNLL